MNSPANLIGDPLGEADYAALEARWITRDAADAALLRRVDSPQGAEFVGQAGRAGDYAGILIPYLWPGDGSVRDYRLRRDHPDLEQGADGKIKPRRKYLSPPGRSNMLYLPPQVEPGLIDDEGLPIVLTEGEFKTLALWRLAWHGRGDAAETPAFLPMGLQGVYSWRGVVGKANDARGRRSDVKGPISDLGRVRWQARRVVIAFDADVSNNLMVVAARRDLTRELEERGAQIAWFRWPDDVSGDLKGIDDFLAARGPAQALKLLAQAKTVTRRRAVVVGPSIENWERHLIRNEDGGIKAILANAILFLRNAPEWANVLGFDEFAQRTRALRGCPWNAEPHDWDDVSDIRLADWLQLHGCHVGVPAASFAVQAVARESAYHPVRDYLRGLTWDQMPRLSRFLPTYLGAADTKYTREVGARWLISAVARVMLPGCQADHCLILQGGQGTGKSTALRIMAGEWFTDDVEDLGSKDSAMQAHGVWIVEFAELDVMLGVRVEMARVKAFVVRRVDHFRPPYGRQTADFPRQCVFAGSVNLSTYLRDETGGRRFWPVTCKLADLAGLARDRDQIWAEARVRFESGESWWLDDRELAVDAESEQDFRYERDPWDAIVWDWIEGARKAWVVDGKPLEGYTVSVEELLSKAVQKRTDAWTQADRYRIGRILRARGLEYVRERVFDADGNPVMDPRGRQQRRYVYRWPTVPPPPAVPS